MIRKLCARHNVVHTYSFFCWGQLNDAMKAFLLLVELSFHRLSSLGEISNLISQLQIRRRTVNPWTREIFCSLKMWNLNKITKMLIEICLLCPSKFTSNSTILIASKSRERLLDDFTHMGQVSQRVLRANFHEKVMNKHHAISPSSKSSLVFMLTSQTWCLSKTSFSTKGLLVFANIPRRTYELDTSETRAAICLSLSKVLWHRGQPLEWTSSLSSLETYLE